MYRCRQAGDVSAFYVTEAAGYKEAVELLSDAGNGKAGQKRVWNIQYNVTLETQKRTPTSTPKKFPRPKRTKEHKDQVHKRKGTTFKLFQSSSRKHQKDILE
eukprot:2714114-Amphidinium_carterae.1